MSQKKKTVFQVSRKMAEDGLRPPRETRGAALESGQGEVCWKLGPWSRGGFFVCRSQPHQVQRGAFPHLVKGQHFLPPFSSG